MDEQRVTPLPNPQPNEVPNIEKLPNTWPTPVMQWLPLLRAEFRKQGVSENLLDKALHVLNYESGGDPNAIGDGGIAIGLAQSHYLKKGASPEQQIADMVRMIKKNPYQWTDWGEGVLYEGKPFGALGNFPYTGEGQSGQVNQPAMQQTRQSPLDVYMRWQAANDALQEYLDSNPGLIQTDEGIGRIGTDEFGRETFIPDTGANQKLQALNSWTRQLETLDKYKSILTDDSALDAAKAFRDSEIDKSGEAARAYKDYATRIEDLNKVEAAAAEYEEIPRVRSANIAEGRNQARDRMQANQNTIDQGGYVPYSGMTIPIMAPTAYEQSGDRFLDVAKDLRGLGQNIRKTIPEQAPQFRPMDVRATEPLPQPGMLTIPFNSPLPQRQEQGEILGPPDSGDRSPVGVMEGPQEGLGPPDPTFASRVRGIQTIGREAGQAASRIQGPPQPGLAQRAVGAATVLGERIQRASQMPTGTGQVISAPSSTPSSVNQPARSIPASQIPAQTGNQQISTPKGRLVRGTGPPPDNALDANGNPLKSKYGTGPVVWYRLVK